MNSSVYHIMRESLRYAAAVSCGEPYVFRDEKDREFLEKAVRLSGCPEHPAVRDALESIFSMIRMPESPAYAASDANGMFAGYSPDGRCDRRAQLEKWKNESKGIPEDPAYAEALLELFEDVFSAVPSPLPGVSCYHWGKAVASLACVLAGNAEKQYVSEKPFALYSIDFSGIQSFIYTISSKGALKALKARSFYLSLLSEHISDMVLSACGMSRGSLVYVGGGRAHFLLSSDPSVIGKADGAVADANRFLRKNFGASLYAASGWAAAGEKDIHSNNGTEASFSELFREASRMISAKKMRRYSYREIVGMNREPVDEEGRICAICGRSSQIVRWKENLHLCLVCSRLESFASALGTNAGNLYVAEEEKDGLPLPAPEGKELALSVRPGAYCRKYTPNRRDPEDPLSVRISLSAHQAAGGKDGNPATFETLAGASEGIRRLGVFRGDVDSLGALFAGGFYHPEDPAPWKMCNLSYYSALSGAMTWFFQRNLDRTIREGTGHPLLQAAARGERVAVVYAGGDDVFLIGAWNDVLDAGLRIQSAFGRYTGGTVTLSGGYSAFTEHTPVPVMADKTAGLESTAKAMDGKNALAVFGTDGSAENAAVQCYHWEDFRRNVLDEKMACMMNLFGTLEDKGNSFLYRVLDYFRLVGSNPMAVSRLAYLLARHLPSAGKGATAEQVRTYKEFMQRVYKWALDEKENKAFRTACLIYVYLNRKVKNEN